MDSADICTSCARKPCNALPDPRYLGCVRVASEPSEVPHGCPLAVTHRRILGSMLFGVSDMALRRLCDDATQSARVLFGSAPRSPAQAEAYLGQLMEQGRIRILAIGPGQAVPAHLVRSPARPAPKKEVAEQIVEQVEAAPPPKKEEKKVRTPVHVIEVPDVLFFHNGRLPCLDREGGLIGALGTALQYAQTTDTLEELVVFGHADTSGDHAANYTVSEQRAKALKSLLDVDGHAWKEIAKEHGQVREYQGILSVLTERHGWACDPGKVDNVNGKKTEAGVRAFQEQANARYGLQLSTDGVVGPKTWQAIHRVLCGLVAKSMGVEDPAQPDYPGWSFPEYGYAKGQGCYGCGESLPIDQAGKDGYRSQKNRRVELTFFPQGQAALRPPANRNAKLTADDCVLMDERKVERKRVEPYPAPWDRITIGDTFWTFFQENMPFVDDAEKFHGMLQAVFGDWIDTGTGDALRNDVKARSLKQPEIHAHTQMNHQQMGAYAQDRIFINRQVVVDANALPSARWLLLLVLLHEGGHHLDYLLRNHYSDRGGDARGDEGRDFAFAYVNIEEQSLLTDTVQFADIHYEGASGETVRDMELSAENFDKEQRARMHHRYYLAGGPEDGELSMPDGSVAQAEFWGVTLKGGAHEEITKEAAKAAGYSMPNGRTIGRPETVVHPADYSWDAGLYQGCAWPDVPFANHPDSPMTDYANFAYVYATHMLGSVHPDNLAYRSHFGNRQIFHSMCPVQKDTVIFTSGSDGTHGAASDHTQVESRKVTEEKFTNKEVKDQILAQLGEWYKHGLALRSQNQPGTGLFHIGKMLHTVQDSYTISHAWRRFVGDDKDNFWKPLHTRIQVNGLLNMPCGDSHHGTIWNFQSYHTQDGGLHGVADKAYSVGYDEALEASIHILNSYKAGESWEKMLAYLDKTVYVIHPERLNARAGDSHPWFRTRLTEAEEPDEEARKKDEKTTRSKKAIMKHVIELRKMVDDYKKSKGKTASASADAEHWFDTYGELICAV